MKFKKTLKRVASLLMVFAMLLNLLPTGVLATDTQEVTVYLTVSVDGDFINSEITGETMARVPVKISYFDLADYGLEKYYRYETGSFGGQYINENLVKQPTILHLYIKALEQYYLGRKLTADDTHAFAPEGEPTSLYMLNFWGHDQNLMYFANHKYPLMDSGWGATADYVLLEDGMDLNVAMFSNYEFFNYGYFSHFENGDEITVSQGETIDFTAVGVSTNTWGGAEENIILENDMISVLYGDSFDNLTEREVDDEGVCSITFDEPGTYYVVSRDIYSGDSDLASIAPSVTKVNVIPEESEGEYDVSVYVGPSGANVKFYECAGFDEKGYDILGKEIVAKDTGVDSDSYHVYKMKMNKGTYSFRGTDARGNSLGGMTFDIPSVVEVDNIDSNTSEVYLRQVNVFNTTKTDDSYADASQYSTEVADSNGRLASSGETFVDSSSRTVYPYLVFANGNAQLYTVSLIPTKSVSEAYNVGTNTMGNYSVAKGTTAVSKSATLPTLINAVITAPSGSRVQVFNQLRNFYTKEVEFSTREESDGLTSYTFRLPKGNGNHTYRVSHEGKITKAGYLKLNSEDTAKTDICFQENEDPKLRPEYDISTTIGSRMEDSILLNINSQNHLRMNVGEDFKVRAYRAWQIINSDTANIMIEPDFEYKIISGDSIRLEQQGQNAIVTAVKDGVSIVEVTYDAIEIGGNTNYTGIYGAIDPMRKGLFVVNVGGNTDSEIVMPEWDSDFDTVYFTEETGTYRFAPESDKQLTVRCNDEFVPADSDGLYTLSVCEGNNIVSLTDGYITEYVVIKGKRVIVNIENATSPGEVIKQGDTVEISFDGLHIPMPKFSGIYNPGYGGTIKATYMKENGRYVQGKGAQYNFITNHTISMTVYETGTVKLTNGTIPFTSMGFEAGAHRNLTDTGVGANFNAVAIPMEFSQLPDISFDVAKNNDLSYMQTAKDTYSNLSKVNILWGTSDYQKAFKINLTTVKAASAKNKNAAFTDFNRAYPLLVTAEPVNDNVTMEFRYWELGDSEKNTAVLTPDKTLTLENAFSGEKTIFMEIAVTPLNAVFGEETVYSYVVYKTDSEKPILKALNIKDGEGNAFEAPYGILYSDNNSGIAYTQNDYYCYIPKNTDNVTISLARLNGTSDVTIGKETQSIGTSEKAFLPISSEGEETNVTISLSDGGNYTVKLIKTQGVMMENIANDSEKLALSFVNTEDAEMDFYAVSYADKSGTPDNIIKFGKNFAPGKNTVFMDISDFEKTDKIALFVWNKSLCPVFEKIIVNK